jgi:protein-tyrosine phosphatase
MESLFHIESAATSREEIGNDVHYGTRGKLEEVGIPCPRRKARQVTKADYEDFDWLLIMDGNNRRNLMRIIGSDPQGKVHRFMEPTARGGDVADPWYTDRFDVTYRDVDEGCDAWLDILIPEARKKGAES